MARRRACGYSARTAEVQSCGSSGSSRGIGLAAQHAGSSTAACANQGHCGECGTRHLPCDGRGSWPDLRALRQSLAADATVPVHRARLDTLTTPRQPSAAHRRPHWFGRSPRTLSPWLAPSPCCASPSPTADLVSAVPGRSSSGQLNSPIGREDRHNCTWSTRRTIASTSSGWMARCKLPSAPMAAAGQFDPGAIALDPSTTCTLPTATIASKLSSSGNFLDVGAHRQRSGQFEPARRAVDYGQCLHRRHGQRPCPKYRRSDG
jgi:hypothetical protein